MNLKKILSLTACALISINAFCEGITSSSSITVDVAYYPKSDYIAGGPHHFAPITGAYSGVEGHGCL